MIKDMSPTALSQLTGIKRKVILEYIKEHYPFFIIGKDKIDVPMALQIRKALYKKEHLLS
jgi:hypothetical protein